MRLEKGTDQEERLLPAVVLQETDGFPGDEILEVMVFGYLRGAPRVYRAFAIIQLPNAFPWIIKIAP